jgi:hypothetical protein
MILLLEVKSGPSKGKGIRLQPGQSVRVGRTSRSDFVLPTDNHLSGMHFEVVLEENECYLRDLKSTNGTLLNGQRVIEAVLHDGDVVVAGETVFRVRTLIGTARGSDSGPPLPSDTTPQLRLLTLLRTEHQPLYAILDAARDMRVLALIMQSQDEHQSLYEGAQGEKLMQVAPYLVRLDKDSLLLASTVFEGWGHSWGVFFTFAGEFQVARRHLRQFLDVMLPDGKQVYFRFYDPRVLRVFLPTCTADETNQFFGPIQHYLMEDDQPDKLLQFANTGHGADKKLFSLIPTTPGDKTAVAKPVDRTLPMPQKAIPKPKR